MLRDDFHPSYSLYKSKACDWLVTRIKRKLHQKIHKKRSKVESAKTEENSHHAWAGANFAQAGVLCEFQGVVRIWSSCLPKAISSSFQLQIVHGLKRWILDFLRFEIVYSM